MGHTLRSTYRGEWRPPVGEFKEPLLAPASAKLLALSDVVADELDAEMNELTEQLRQQAQEEMMEVGDVGEIKKLLACVCEWVGARAGVKR